MKDKILNTVGKNLIPFIQIFGLYVIFHGHLSPGGGFAGGTIIGVSFILYRIIFGKEFVQNKLRFSLLIRFLTIGVFIYGVMKGYIFISGGSDLHWATPPLGIPGSIISGGFLLPLNIIVGTVVSVTMYFFYCLFEEGEI
ncbi:multicomponent Na+:H+ antiporter subunit B [Sedimentibacter acidaminivorans]|uniref:Multicomponent Na+:H+ antiporter subunit B n=1 Tax=Sedimentibacter acidaminivorans TaxID=913099 RepID=A0ABS4GE76_9FIRM|nr:MnhB domain-containing protein [Sedimentibacter acidaminivorans]MBP1926002.1 multicomponent Na+:H+ antiporter subunit B [Sedimentibacter acidaminivorans]